MDTNRIKRFATEARNKLKEGIAAKIRTLGFDKKGNVAEEHRPQLMQGGTHWNGQLLPETFYHQWTSLFNRIQQKGISEVYEEAAYTWFNRLCAIRILQKNDLCAPVLDYTDAARTPFIVDEARQGRLPEMNDEMRSRLSDLLDDDTKVTEQFAVLINAWCHDNPIINSCFGAMADYTELLLPNNILTEGGFVDMLNHTDFITEADYCSPELIGWLYQFYISERKDEVFAKKGKFEADEIPAATQIFTPNWIVKYMVQNTVGRIYLENNPYETQLQKKWKYLVGGDATRVTTNANASSQGCGESPHLLFDELTDLRVADLACGSGHILNECFDLLYDLYIAEGYGRGEAIENIFRHNLTGVDLDTRAKQLATFALLLKACQKDNAFADAHCLPNVLDMTGIVPDMNEQELSDACLRFIGGYENVAGEMLEQDFELLRDADNLGSIMKFNDDEDYLAMLRYHYEDWTEGGIDDCPKEIKALIPGVRLILALTEKYHALIANPPYMGRGHMTKELSSYLDKNYPTTKADLFSAFMEMMLERTLDNGKTAFITMESWMFLSSFEKFRKYILDNYFISSMGHFGWHIIGIAFGTAMTVIDKCKSNGRKGEYSYLTIDDVDRTKNVPFVFPKKDNGRYAIVNQQDFEKIPGCPIGYWVSENKIKCFRENIELSNFGSLGKGLDTGDNNLFLRLWHEISNKNKWLPCQKGGTFRKWYGNNSFVINWENDGYAIRNHKGSNIRNERFYLKSGFSWSRISSSKPSFRHFDKGFIFESTGPCGFFENELSILGFINSCVAADLLSTISPTMDFQSGHISKLPFKCDNSYVINELVKQNISISKQDWDAHETSWDFETNPLLAIGGDATRVTTNANASSQCCGESPQLLGGDATRVTTQEKPSQQGYGESPYLLRFVNKNEYIHINGNKLPHWNQNDCVQFVTFRLADSLPQSKLFEYKKIKEEWLAAHPKPWDEATQEEYDRVIGTKIDKWLDAGYGSCILQDERIRKIVEDSILHFNGEKYNIHAYVIMPNHVHVLLSPIGEHLIQKIVGNWKVISSHQINKLRNTVGAVWEKDIFDRMVRDNEDFEAKFNYIAANPQGIPPSSYTLSLGGDATRVTINNDSTNSCCGESPQLLLEDLMNAYKQKWEHLFMQLHENEEELNRQFIDIYGLQDELTPDVPLDEITILQQGEVSFNL